MVFSNFGVIINSNLPAHEVAQYAVKAEKLQFDYFWIGEALLYGRTIYRSSVPHATLCSLSTRKIKIGIGVTSPLLRHPFMLAVEASGLNELSEGRFVLGLGTIHDVLQWLGFDLRKTKPFSSVKDAVQICRYLLYHQPQIHEMSEFPFHPPSGGLEFGYGTRLSPPPIYVGALRPRMLKMTGELADGLILDSATASSPKFIKRAVDCMSEAARAKGRDVDEIDVVANTVISIAKDRNDALSSVRPLVTSRISRYPPESFYDDLGVREEELEPIRSAFLAGRKEDAESMVTEELISKYAIAGNPEDCIKRLEGYQGSGLKNPAFMLEGSSNRFEAMELISEKVIPYLKDKA